MDAASVVPSEQQRLLGNNKVKWDKSKGRCGHSDWLPSQMMVLGQKQKQKRLSKKKNKKNKEFLFLN